MSEEGLDRENFCIILLRLSRYLQQQLISLQLPLSAMSRKRAREFSPPSKYVRVAWTEKRTRRGNVSAADIITTPGPAQTPTRPKKMSKQVKFTLGETSRAGEVIIEAISLPPIPIPDILASKKDRRGKV